MFNLDFSKIDFTICYQAEVVDEARGPAESQLRHPGHLKDLKELFRQVQLELLLKGVE